MEFTSSTSAMGFAGVVGGIEATGVGSPCVVRIDLLLWEPCSN